MTKRRLGDCLQALPPLFRHHYLVTIIRHYLSSLSRRLRELRRPPELGSRAAQGVKWISAPGWYHFTGAPERPFAWRLYFGRAKENRKAPRRDCMQTRSQINTAGDTPNRLPRAFACRTLISDRRQGSQKQLLGFQFLSSNQLALGHAAPLETSTHPLVEHRPVEISGLHTPY